MPNFLILKDTSTLYLIGMLSGITKIALMITKMQILKRDLFGVFIIFLALCLLIELITLSINAFTVPENKDFLIHFCYSLYKVIDYLIYAWLCDKEIQCNIIIWVFISSPLDHELSENRKRVVLSLNFQRTFGTLLEYIISSIMFV